MSVSGRSESTRRRLFWLLGQATFVVLCIYLYFRIRNITEGSRDVAVENAQDVVDLERNLGIYVEEGLQEPFLTSNTLLGIANAVYVYGHWPVIVATMVWTAWRHRVVFLRLRDAMVVSGLLGMVVFVTWPLAPPRLANLGLVDTITQENTAYRVLQPTQFTNQFAAMPSLHAGWDLLVGIAIVTAASTTAVKLVGYAMPVLMTISVVVTANHYILDVVAGIALVLVGHAAALALERRRRARAAASEADPSPGPETIRRTPVVGR
jgi:membrane-associated phospholipid phosphatase